MASVVSNFNQSPEKVLIDLINAENGTNFGVGDLMFGFPAVLSEDPDHNTRVLLDPTKASQRAGWVYVNYNRVSLEDIKGSNPSSFFLVPTTTMMHQLLARLSAKWNARFGVRDLVNQEFPDLPDLNPVTVTFTAGVDSLVYSGSSDITVQPALLISGTVLNATLDGIPLVSTDPNETAHMKLVSLLNEANPMAGYEFRTDNVEFTNPTPATGSGYNTQANAVGVENTEYYGTVPVRYYRVDLSAVTEYLGFTSEAPFTQNQIAQLFNEELQSFLRGDDLNAIAFPTVENGVVKNITITAKSTSLGWVGTKAIQIVTGIPDMHDALNVYLNQTYPGYFDS